MTAAVLDWGAAGNALHAFVASATSLPVGSVIWAQQNDAPQPGAPWATLALSGPRPLGAGERRLTSQTMQDTITVVAAMAQTYTVTVDGVAYAYVAGGGDTVTTIRDGLEALLTPGETDLTFTDVGADAIRVDGTGARPHFHITTTPAANITRLTVVDAICEQVYWPAEVTLSVDIRTASAVPGSHARTYSDRLPIAAHQDAERVGFRAADLAFIRIDGHTDLTGLEGPDFVSRMVTDLVFMVGPQAQADLNWINTLTTTPTWN